MDYYKLNDYGVVINILSTSDNLFEENNQDGLIAGIAKLGDYVENGQLKTPSQKPGEEYIFDYQQKKWVLDSFRLRGKRDELLRASDWTQLPDVPLATKQAWATYRQALRDITAQESYPFSVIWPTKPE